MALSLPHLAPAGNAFASWGSLGREVPEYMASAPYQNVQVLVVGWELRHVWEDLRQLDVPEISFARRENYFEALACRPTTIVYNSDRGARPPIVGGLIGIAPPAFVAVGGDALLAALRRRAEEHKYTTTIGRSHAIHAEPPTFGLKLPGHYAALQRGKTRLPAARPEIRTCPLAPPGLTFARHPPPCAAPAPPRITR